MLRHGKNAMGTALLLILLLAAVACSPEGGRQETSPDTGDAGGEQSEQVATGGGEGDYTVAMVTHAPEGDTFFDIIRAGADGAAEGRNITYEYSADNDPTRQASLIQNAIDRGVDGLAVANPSPEALNRAIQSAVDAGIPVVMFNAGVDAWQDAGAMSFFGQEETVAGQAAGERLNEDGAEKVLCVPQAQGQVQLEARCDGAAEAFDGESEKLYVQGTDMPSVRSSIASKLQEDPDITHVLMLGAPFALAAVDAVTDAGSDAQVVTFDTNSELVGAIESGDVAWAVDQQPYLQGYLSIDALRLYLTNGNVIGGGEPVYTGPSFVDETNVAEVAEYARAGTR